MKKSILPLCLLLLVVNVLPAQTSQEALSLSTSNYLLSARQTAMGGASGALFSEMGAIAVNPAILGTYETCELSFTPLYYNVNSKSDYAGTVQSTSRFGFVLGNAGVVYSVQPRGTGNRYNIAFTYNRTNNFNVNNFAGKSQAVSNSFWQEMSNKLNSGPLPQEPFGQQYMEWGTQKAIEGKLFIKDGDNNYSPIVTGNVNQEINIDMTGNIGEYALSFGTNLSNVVNIGISAILRDAELSTIHYITERTADIYYHLTDRSRITGLGVGGKIGITVNANRDLNFGIAVHSPVYYSLSHSSELRIEDETSYIYKSGVPRESNFNLLTPVQFVLSASYNVMDRVLLAFDYEGTPYSMANLSASEGDNLDNVNTEVDESSFVSAVRLGAEVPVWRGLSVRAGGGYKSALNASNKGIFNVGGGAGYRFGEASVDLAYSYVSNKIDYTLYELAGIPMIMNNTKGSHFVNVSLSYRF